MSRVKLTADNHCHSPVKGGAAVEALIDAAAAGALASYLEQGHSVNVVANQGISALHALARNKSGTPRDRAALSALLEAGIDVNMVNNRKESALFRAIFTGSYWMCEALMERGARLDVVNSKGVTLDDLASKKNPAIIASLAAWRLNNATPVPTYSRPRRSI